MKTLRYQSRVKNTLTPNELIRVAKENGLNASLFPSLREPTDTDVREPENAKKVSA